MIKEDIMFNVKDTVKCLTGKYRGRSMVIESFSILHNPTLYLVQDYIENKKLAYFEDELQSIVDHDMNGINPQPKERDVGIDNCKAECRAYFPYGNGHY